MPDFASISDLINGGFGDKTTPQGYMGALFDDPEYRRQRAFDMLGNIGAALLKASGPTTGPADFGTVLSQGLAGVNEGRQASEDRYLRRLMTGSQIARNQSEMQRDKEWSDLFKTPATAAPAPQVGQAAPAAAPPQAAAGSPNPNNIGNVRPVGSNTGFQQPASFDDGVRLAVNNVKAYPQAFNNGQPMTLVQIGQRWAPKGDGANDPNQWAANVAAIGGLDPNQPLDLNDPVTAAKFARGVHGAEWGQAALKDPAVYTAALTNPGIPQGSGGDGSGNPVQPVQYNPQAMRPQTMQEAVNQMPEGLRKMVGSMPRKEGMAFVMKYMDPGSEVVMDTQTGQPTFIPKTMVGRDPRFQPIEVEKFNLDRRRLSMEEERNRRSAANDKVEVGPDGQMRPNETLIEYEKRIKALNPETVVALDTQTGRPTFINKDQVGKDPRFMPLEAQKWEEEQRKRESETREKTFAQSSKLRGDFDGLQPVKDYSKANTVFRSAVEASKGDSKASDINMVYAFATLMDPGSVVRDSETGMVYATQGASERVKGLVAGLQGKSGLGKETKDALLREMGIRYESYKSAYDSIADTFKGIAERHGLNPQDVIVPVAPVEWSRPEKKGDKTPVGGIPQPKTRAEYDQLPAGATYVDPEGKTRTKGGAP